MKTSEIFYSIQGEGLFTGMPSVFIRVAGCNLRCGWCDSKYALPGTSGKQLNSKSINNNIRHFPTRYVVITGGEPMLYNDVRSLARLLISEGKHVTIETNATYPPKGISCSLASLSPKLSNSTPARTVGAKWRELHEKRRINIDAIRAWVAGYDYQLKFVVRNRKDITEVARFVEDIGQSVVAEKVFLMPEGVRQSVIEKRSDIVVDACREFGFRYCDRLQIKLFGNKRGK